MTKKQKGFTLVELMIVVAIIGVLAAVAIPKFADMLEKSREGATKGNLSAIKSAVSNYYADQQGVYPLTLDTQTSTIGGVGYTGFQPNYIDILPSVKVSAKYTGNTVADTGKGPGIGNSAGTFTYGNWAVPGFSAGSSGKGWKYNNGSGDVWVNSGMLDMSGNSYTVYGFQ